MPKYYELVKSARNLADMIALCERIEWGQDSAKLHECADAVEALRAENVAALEAIGDAEALRAAQQAYMADRGNDVLGKKVGKAAKVLDKSIDAWKALKGRGGEGQPGA